MWLYLVTEFMFFGGLFTAYIVYRSLHPEGFVETSVENSDLRGAHHECLQARAFCHEEFVDRVATGMITGFGSSG
jgi:heme/copper-type cytochrome/quinol oxidase subunit 3